MTIDQLLNSLNLVTRAGRGWVALCPAHDDHRSSLSIGVGEDQRLLLHCHAGCTLDDILEALTLQASDLFPDKEPIQNRRIEATYDYVDENGTLLFQAVRYDPKDFRQRRPGKGGQWEWNLQGVRRVPYRLPEVLAAIQNGERIFIVEGEKDADNLHQRGLVATCNPQGAGKWQAAYSEMLRGARVVILPDNDVPGRQHAHTIARSLLNVAAEVRWLELPNLPPKGDVTNWLADGGTADTLQRLAEEAPLYSVVSVDCVVPESGENAEPDWEPITPMDNRDLPVFPTHIFPDWLRQFVEAVALATQTPPDLAAMLVLSVCALAVAKRARICPRPGWYESLNIYTLVALPPGSRKSAVFSISEQPVEDYERAVNTALAPEIEQARLNREILAARLEKMKKAAAHADSYDDRLAKQSDANALQREIAELKVPAALRLTADDATPEVLCSLLSEQGGRIAVLSPEGDIFSHIAGRYNDKSPNVAPVFLKGHPGDLLRVDRVGRAAEYIPHPALTLGLAVQPEVLRGLARKPGFRGLGLLGRFMFSLPYSNLGYRNTQPPSVPAEVLDGYRQGVERLLELKPQAIEDDEPRPYLLYLEPAAQRLFDAYCAEVEVRLRAGEILGDMKDWGGKLCGHIARIAAILHLAEYGDPTRNINEHTMRMAITLDAYLVAHARAAYTEMGMDQDAERCRILAEWIQRKEITQFTKREAHNALQSWFPQASDLDKPLSMFMDRDWIREIPREHKEGPGRKASPRFQVNPGLHNLQKLQNGVPDPNSVDCVVSVDEVEEAIF